MNYFLNLILLLIGTLSYGQTLILQGNIRDANTHEAIQYVNIHVQGTNIGTVTNVYGDFLLSNMKIKPHDTLAFSSIGYKTSKLIASKITGNFKLNLVPYIRQIDQITVNEKRTVPSDILIKAYQKLPENIYNKNYQTKVFSRNFIQMDSIPISYRKSVTQVNANKDNVWYRPGEILADQYQTLPKNIFKILSASKNLIFRTPLIKVTNELTKEMVISVCSYNYIFANSLWTMYGICFVLIVTVYFYPT